MDEYLIRIELLSYDTFLSQGKVRIEYNHREIGDVWGRFFNEYTLGVSLKNKDREYIDLLVAFKYDMQDMIQGMHRVMYCEGNVLSSVSFKVNHGRLDIRVSVSAFEDWKAVGIEDKVLFYIIKEIGRALVLEILEKA
nr:MAG TPA: hypothetical protein [Bacteriophage sp.]